jgi:hypothetical protein
VKPAKTVDEGENAELGPGAPHMEGQKERRND